MERAYEIIVNPASRSGRGLLIWQELVPVLKEHHIDYHVSFSEKPGDCMLLAQKAESDFTAAKDSPKKHCLIVLGGDGTLNEVLQGLHFPLDFPIGYIPTGSSNDFARAVGLPATPKESLLLILYSENTKLLDIGTVNFPDFTRTFAVSCGIGFDAAVCHEALSSKSKKILNKIGLGNLTYLLIALKQLISAKRVSCRLVLENGAIVEFKRILFLTAMLQPFEGGGFMFCPGADCTDGFLDVCIVGNLPKLRALAAFPTAYKGEHYKFKGIHRFRVKEMTFTLSTPLWLHTDGEVTSQTDYVSVQCETARLPIVCE